MKEAKTLGQLSYKTLYLYPVGQNLVTGPHPAARKAGKQYALLKTRSSSIWKKRRTDSGRLCESGKHLPSCLHNTSAHRPNLASSSQPKLLSQQKASLQGWKLHTMYVGSGRGKINLNQTQERCWRAVNFIVYEKMITLKAI